nr:hypothetical protein [Tanacetum cinerariifolium]
MFATSVNPLIDHHCCYKCGNSLNDFFYHQCTCEFCGNGAHVGYNCPAQVPSIQTLPSFPQQYPCCEDYGGLPEAYQFQPSQYTVNHPIFNAYNDLFNSQNKLMEQLTSMCDMVGQFIQKKEEEKQIEEEQAAKAQNWKLLSSVENLVPNPSESEDEYKCDVPACEDFTTFSNILFDADYDFYSSDDQSFSDEEFPKEIYSNPVFDEEIISMKIDPHHFNDVSDLIESLLNHDSSIISSSSKIDSLFDEFAGELTLLKSIPPRIDETDCDPEEETHFNKRLLYDNSSSRPPEEFVCENSDAIFESFSPSPIRVEDSDSLVEEIYLSFTPDHPISSVIEEDDYDSERDIIILEELFSSNSLLLPENESFHFDIPSFSRPPTKPPDGNTEILNVKVMGDISKQKVTMPRLMITLVPNQEKSPDLLSHLGHEAFQPSVEYPMMIHERNTPILDVLLFHFCPL